MKKLKILFVISEIYPLVKTGGLADVAYSLPKALINENQEVRVIIPHYSQIDMNSFERINFVTAIYRNEEKFDIYSLEYDNLIVYIIQNETFFERESIYENEDRDLQFALFSDISIRLLKKINFKADIIHCNDWQTGLIPYFMNTYFKKNDKFYSSIKTVFTVHNLRYQGWFGEGVFKYLDYEVPEGNINFLRLAIENADILNTVSKTYLEEIKTEYFGEGLNYEVLKRENDFYGIMNGIDYDLYNSEDDPNIYENYGENNLIKKQVNKVKLQEELKLKIDKDIPVISIISRLIPQKGIDLIECVIQEMLETDKFELLVLGTGDSNYVNMFYELHKEYSNKVHVKIGYDEILARKMYAGSDIILIPSAFEPCGLNQMIAMRYGTIPVVRETGGLNDTVKSYDYVTDKGNGFSFRNYNAHDMMYTIRRAIDIYNKDKMTWNKLMKRAVKGKYSWKESAKKYLELYLKVLDKN